MGNLVSGIFIGALIMFFLNKLVMTSYKRTLVMKARDKTAEHINGHFYYIVPESEYNKSNLNNRIQELELETNDWWEEVQK